MESSQQITMIIKMMSQSAVKRGTHANQSQWDVFTHVMSKHCLVQFTTIFLHKAKRAVTVCSVLCFTRVFSSASCVLCFTELLAYSVCPEGSKENGRLATFDVT